VLFCFPTSIVKLKPKPCAEMVQLEYAASSGSQSVRGGLSLADAFSIYIGFAIAKP
jgi:hypothetical protein